MSKVRVHELAKEINKTSKEIMDYLKGNGADIKSHMSFLTESQVDDVKRKFAGAVQTEGTPKKKTIVQVFRPQNTQSGQRRQGGKAAQRSNSTVQAGKAGMEREKKDTQMSGQERGRDNNRGPRDGRDNNRGPRDGRDNNRGPRDGRDNNRGPKDGRDNNRGPKDGRNNNRGPRNGRDNSRGPRDGRDNNRQGRGGRDNRNNNGPSIPAPMVVEQKPQRKAGKDNYKKKEYDRDEEREGR